MEALQKTSSRRLASLVALAVRARRTLERFPLVILSAFGAALVLHRLADINFATVRGAEAYYPALTAFILGIPLFLALQLLVESQRWSTRLRLATTVVGLLLVALYYFLVPFPIRGADLFRYFQLLAVFHLLVTFVPFLSRANGQRGFWQYNKALLLRFLLAALYSLVLYVGLALAIAACETLLDFDLDSEIYLQLWFWVVLAYNTWFFLAGIPEDISALEQVDDYPTGLRVFTQYVLIPLVAVYLLILYAYMAKIVIQWELPKGWVGFPVIGVSVTGMLALLLVYPIRDRAENAWISTFAKYFHWSLFPLIALISVAIGTRINDYGITENRYAVVVLTAWLFAITVYFTFKRRKDIRAIPISLSAVIFVSAFGPWSATAVSRRSQIGRLEQMLVSEEVMVDGVLDARPKTIPFDRQKEISNVVKYLYDFHGLSWMLDWYARADRLTADMSYNTALDEMGLQYISPRTEKPEGFAFSASPPIPLPISGFDYLYEINEFWPDSAVSHFRVSIDSATDLVLDGNTLRLGQPRDTTGSLTADLTPRVLELSARTAEAELRPGERVTLDLENARYHLLMYLVEASGRSEDDSLRISHLSAKFLVTIKR